MNQKEFLYLMAVRGWVLFPQQISSSFLQTLKKDLRTAIARCDLLRKKNGLGEGTLGAAHHLVGYEKSFLDLLGSLPLLDFVESYLGTSCILNSFGGAFNQQELRTYLLNPHRDTKVFSRGTPSMVNMLLMLDDFTLENGATYILSGSHHLPESYPSQELFYQAADRLVGPAGSLVLFDGNCWHAAGANTTLRDRGVLTLTFTIPYLKPQLDYMNLFEDPESLSPQVKKLLGFYAQIPQNLEEWYQPLEKRKFNPTESL